MTERVDDLIRLGEEVRELCLVRHKMSPPTAARLDQAIDVFLSAMKAIVDPSAGVLMIPEEMKFPVDDPEWKAKLHDSLLGPVHPNIEKTL